MFGGGNYGSTYWGDKIVNFETINFYGPFDIGSQLGTAGETINIVNSGGGYSTTNFTSSSNANITYTGAGAETVILGSGNDTVNLNQSDDTVTGGAGNDTIDGGDGTDIAIFSGDKSNYTITETGYAQYQVVDNQGTDGTDTLSNIETLRFSDQDFDITPSGQKLEGDSSDNTLEGAAGDDLIYLSLIHI